MATTIEVSHDFPFSPEQYIEIFFAPEFASYVLSKGRLETYEAERLERTETDLERVMLVVPKVELPAWLKRAIGGKKLAYREHMAHKFGSGEIDVQIVPTVLDGRITVKGRIRITPLDGGGCRRAASLTVKAAVFGVGGRIESGMGKSIRDGYAGGRENMIGYYNEKMR